MTRTATGLHLDGGKLKRLLMAADGVAKRATTPSFVELVAPQAGALAQCAIELEGAARQDADRAEGNRG